MNNEIGKTWVGNWYRNIILFVESNIVAIISIVEPCILITTINPKWYTKTRRYRYVPYQ